LWRVRVLVVDQDGAHRATIAGYLRAQGDRVVEVANARAALLALTQDGADLLVVSVGSDRPDGHLVAERARALLPRLRVIYTTDWSESVRPVSEAVFLGRPVRLPALAEALRWLCRATD